MYVTPSFALIQMKYDQPLNVFERIYPYSPINGRLFSRICWARQKYLSLNEPELMTQAVLDAIVGGGMGVGGHGLLANMLVIVSDLPPPRTERKKDNATSRSSTGERNCSKENHVYIDLIKFHACHRTIQDLRRLFTTARPPAPISAMHEFCSSNV